MIPLLLGPPGVSPATGDGFTQDAVESVNPSYMSFNESGETPAVPVSAALVFAFVLLLAH